MSADLVFTDPPYGMKKESDGVLNDNLNFDDLMDFNRQWIPLSFDALKENGSWYCWGIDEPLMDIYSSILKPMQKNQVITFRNLITWDKGSVQGESSDGLRMYARADEKCLFVMKEFEGNSIEFYDEDYEPIRQYMESEAIKAGLNRKKLQEITGVQMWGHWFSKSQFAIIPENHYLKLQEVYKGKAFEKPYRELRDMFGGDGKGYFEKRQEKLEQRAFFDNTHDVMNDVWHFARPSEKEKEHAGGHATPKPLALCARAIKSSSREGEYVLDLFGGSGSTLMACEQLNRKCLMMELSPQYVDVIVNRWEHMTGNKAVLLTE